MKKKSLLSWCPTFLWPRYCSCVRKGRLEFAPCIYSSDDVFHKWQAKLCTLPSIQLFAQCLSWICMWPSWCPSEIHARWLFSSFREHKSLRTNSCSDNRGNWIKVEQKIQLETWNSSQILLDCWIQKLVPEKAQKYDQHLLIENTSWSPENKNQRWKWWKGPYWPNEK